MSDNRRGERENLLVDLTEVDPGKVMSERHSREYNSLDSDGPSSLISSGASSTTTNRRIKAAKELNRDLLFGETTIPDDLDPEWSFVSAKNAQKRTVHATGTLDTLVHLIKGNVGPGLLSLAFAVSNAGYVVGPISILFIGTIAIHNMGLLLDSAKTLCKWNGIQALDYAETLQFAVKERGGSPGLTKAAKVAVNIFLIITQFGFCSVYFKFLGTTLHQVMKDAYCIDWDIRAWTAIMIPPIIIFSWIRNLDSLAPLALLANIGIFFGLFVIIGDELFKLSTKEAIVTKEPEKLSAYGSFIHTCVFFGNAIYSFEGIGVVLPLENKMKRPENAKKVVYGGMTFIVCLFASFSLTGYLVYGDRIQASIPLNLCGTNDFTSMVFIIAKLGIGVAIFITYMIMFYVPMDFLEPYVYQLMKLDVLTYKYPRHHNIIQSLVQVSFRTTLVLITALLALAIEDLDDLITLVGAVASSALALIFPPLIETLTYWNDPERKWFWYLPRKFWVVKNIAIMAFGILGFALGTFAALHNITIRYEGKEKDVSACGDDLYSCPFYVR